MRYPLWLWLPGVLLTGLLLAIISRRHRADAGDRLALLGTLSALMLAAMALPLGPLGYHFTLAPAVGILLGGGMAFVAAAVVNTILALLGHGGFTTVGLNAIIMGSAAASASFAFLHMRPRWGAFPRRRELDADRAPPSLSCST